MYLVSVIQYIKKKHSQLTHCRDLKDYRLLQLSNPSPDRLSKVPTQTTYPKFAKVKEINMTLNQRLK